MSDPETAQPSPPEQNRRNLRIAIEWVQRFRAIIFHPQRLWLELTTWPVVSFLFALLVGIGVGVLSMSPPLFWVAKLCFLFATVIALAKIAHWLSTSRKGGKAERVILAFLIFGLTGAGLVWAWSWINENQLSQKRLSEDAPAVAGSTELQMRDPVLVIEPEDMPIRGTADHRFKLTLYNAGTCDLERVEVYEDYYNVASINPLKFEVAGPVLARPNTVIPTLPSKVRADVMIDGSMAWPMLTQWAKDPQRKNHQWIVRLKFRYRRSFDGVTFTSGKVMFVAGGEILIGNSGREMPQIPGVNIPWFAEIEKALGGMEQKRDN